MILRKFLVIVLALAALLAVGASAAPKGVDFASPTPVMELKPLLTRYHASTAPETDGSHWFMLTIANNAVKPAVRVLVAGEPANSPLHFFPRHRRPAIAQIASSDAGIVVERARALGRHAFRVIVPPATTAALAVRLSDADAPPSLLAWTEPALVANNRQLSVFVAAVAGLIAAALAITAGLAVMTAHAAPRWAALALLAVLMGRISTTGMLDSGWITAVGGPYGLQAMFAGLALVAGARLADIVAPLESAYPWAVRYRRGGFLGVAGLSLLAFVGFPGATLLLDPVVVFGTAGVASYLVHEGRRGTQAARVIAPSAAVFALVALAGAVAALGGFKDNPLAPAMIGGFDAVGAVLLALAVAAGEGIAILPGLRPAPYNAPPMPDPQEKQASANPEAFAAIAASHQGVFDLDARGDTLHLSAEAAQMIGLDAKPETMPHIAWIARVHPEDRDTYKQAMDDYRARPGQGFRLEFRVRSETGRYPWFELRATMTGKAPRANRCLGLLADVTTRKESEAAMIVRAQADALTGLGNRVALMEELDQLGARLKTVIFALIDIDRFKSIHASLGDDGANGILTGFAQRLKKRFGKEAQIFRVGGDSFALIFSGGEPEKIGAALLELSAEPFPRNLRKIFAPISAGLAAGSEAEEPLELLKNAELALLDAKRAGGACARIYSRDLERLAPGDAVALEADLRRALEENQLDIYYQPIVRLADNTVAGFEALMRWHHPTKGLLTPAGFVAHSEQTGLIVSLGRFALERAAADIARWQRYFPIEPPLFASVNVSRRQLRDNDFEEFLSALMTNGALLPGTLKLEVTESAVATSGDLRAILDRLRALGAGLSIDDFGTGLSNLSQLKDIPFDTLKIDQSFLAHRKDAEDSDGAVVLGSIVSLTHELKREVIVEGVENARDAAWLKELGCEYGQGFYFSEPLAPGDVLNYIALHYQASGAPRMGGET